MAILKEDIQHLQDLARLEFGEDETEKLAKDLGEVLLYVETLKEADVSGVSEKAYALEGVKNVFRKDSAEGPLRGAAELDRKSDLAKELIYAFPKKDGDYLKVKPILWQLNFFFSTHFPQGLVKYVLSTKFNFFLNNDHKRISRSIKE